MKIEIYILANIISSILYLSKGLVPETVISVVSLITMNALVLILYSKKKLHPIVTVLISGITAAVWLPSPVSVLLLLMPVILILFGGLKGFNDNIYTIGWGVRIGVILYGIGIYAYKVLRFGLDFQELGLLIIFIILISIFSENFSKNASNIKKVLAKEKVTSIYDKLTGLLSRTTMKESITDAAKKIDVFSIIMMDVDKFKTINDTFGHLNGDIILKDLSQIIKSNIRKTDLAFRYGGDEFIILCSKTSAEEAKSIADRIRVTFNNKVYNFNNEEQHFHVSLGIAECKYGEFESVSNIIKKADQALYKSKQNGRNTVSIYRKEEGE